MDHKDDGPASPPDAVIAAQAVYTPLTLPLYDFLVHGMSNRFAWRCPTEKLIDLYRRNLSINHLEAGCGTGYFIDAAGPPGFQRLVLLDLNRHCLERSAARLVRYRPKQLEANLFEPISGVGEAVGSIGLTYVLHCLPGGMDDKLRAIDHLRRFLHEGGVLFGATILGRGIRANPAAKTLLALYNAKGVFNNRGDDVEALERGLRQRFRHVHLQQIGCVALFAVR